MSSDPPGNQPSGPSSDRVEPHKDSKEARFVQRIKNQRAALRRVARMYGTTPQDVEDIEQDILAQLWKAFDSYDPTRPFGTWMYRVALNTAISSVRRTASYKLRTAPLGPEPFDPPDPKSQPKPESQDAALLQRFINTLDEFDRALLTLHFEAHSYREIAAILGITQSNVGTKLSRLRQSLQQLTTQGSTP